MATAGTGVARAPGATDPDPPTSPRRPRPVRVLRRRAPVVTLRGASALHRGRRRPAHRRRYPRPETRSRWLVGLAVVVLGAMASGVVASAGTSTVAVQATTTVVVRPGDTLSAIAARYGTTVAAITSLNHIADPDQVRAGTTLSVPVAPATTPTAPAAAAAVTVVVRPGDTLTSIAARHGTTVAALVAYDHITDPDVVLAGSRLAIPPPPVPPGWGPGGPLPPLLLAHPERIALRPDFVTAAAAMRLPASLLEALCWWESGWASTVTSSTGALGLCQLEPSTVSYARASLLHQPWLDPMVANDNIAMAAAYLKDLSIRDGGDLRTAVAAYYQGLASVQHKGLLPSTQTYVTGIFNYSTIFAAAG